ncbi:MAG TPA: hypothetical protein VFP80_01895, partial [Thermoanaerobaculia bacterium]|nr:hypothetical protein [Thermoanaerobaculia bacterium]
MNDEPGLAFVHRSSLIAHRSTKLPASRPRFAHRSSFGKLLSMRGRVQVLLLLVSLSIPAFPQCSWTPRASAQFRTTALDVAVQDGFVWLATGYGVTLIDANTLTVADSVALPGSTRVIHTDARGVTYAGSGSRLYVLTRNGNTLNVVRFVDAGGTVNDIAAAGSYLFVATSNGLAHFDALEATNPIRHPVLLPTTSTNVTSVAATPQRLYAADGDASVDIFAISVPSIPQRTGELASLPFATAVHATGDMVLVSDVFGQNTDVFIGSSRVARLTVGTNAFAAFANGVHFTAGADRTLRVVDFNSTAAAKEIYEHTLSPIGGTDHVIHEMVRAGNKLYVAAGDIGLAVYDLGTLAPPYPVAAYRTSTTTTTVLSGDRAWFADATGLITETKIDPSGLSMTTERTWMGGVLVQDVDGTNLLTSKDATATIWSLSGATPAQTQTATFRTTVTGARFHGNGMVALLADGSVWTGGATPQQVSLPKIAFLDRAGTTWTFAENNADAGTTVVHHFPTSDLAATPSKFSIPGAATGLATSPARIAVHTFGGLRVLNHDGSTHATLSLPLLPRKFTFSGNDLLVLGDRSLLVYDDAKTLVRTHELPANGVAVDAAPSVATIATAEGMMAVSYLGTPPPPPPVVPFAGRFYSKVVAAGERAYLFDSLGIDVFSTATGTLPRYMTSVSAAGVLDVAATPGGLFTLSANGTVSAYSPHGVLLRSMTINEGPDTQPLAIDAAGSAVWVSISKGCLTGGCQNRTLVLDPSTMTVAATMNGTVADVVTANDRAYALFELPNEVRVLNVANPLQPAQIMAIAAPNRAVSVATHQNRVLVLGDRLYEYAETLVLKGTHLSAISPDRAQQVRVDGNCLLITARGASPETYNAATLIP